LKKGFYAIRETLEQKERERKTEREQKVFLTETRDRLGNKYLLLLLCSFLLSPSPPPSLSLSLL